MDRLEHGRRGAIGIDIGRGRKAEPALDGGAEIGEDIAEQVGGDDDVERSGAMTMRAAIASI